MALKELARSKAFGGHVVKFSHQAACLGALDAKFTVYLPPKAAAGGRVPVLFCLAGLTCTEDNFIQKSGALRKASQLGIALVCPDTSPRGASVEGEDDSWDFGTGAGFYVDATEEKWKSHYRMYTYIVDELPKAVQQELPLDLDRCSITGHSMGGHGALTIYLKNPGKYKSASAFAPIANPIKCNVGQKAFSGYFGTANPEAWAAHDATELVKRYRGPALNWLVDQGSDDEFLQTGNLLPNNLLDAVKGAGRSGEVRYRLQDGYDHSYYFISSFIDDHLEHHANYLL